MRIDFAYKNAEHRKLANFLKQLTKIRKKVRLRYIKHPPTLRTFQANKMAVGLPTLISLFRDSKPEK